MLNLPIENWSSDKRIWGFSLPIQLVFLPREMCLFSKNSAVPCAVLPSAVLLCAVLLCVVALLWDQTVAQSCPVLGHLCYQLIRICGYDYH